MRVGESVYRVVELDLPDEREHTWMVTSRRVVKIRKDGKFILDSPFSGMPTKVMGSHCLGTFFYLTPADALSDFRASRERDFKTAERMCATAQRAVDWSLQATLDLDKDDEP